MPPAWGEFGARVFKVSEDAGTRLSWLKVTGGVLHVKDTLPGGEKADTLRLYSGGKFRPAPAKAWGPRPTPAPHCWSRC